MSKIWNNLTNVLLLSDSSQIFLVLFLIEFTWILKILQKKYLCI